MLVPAYVFLLHVFSSIRLSGTGEKRTVTVALFLKVVGNGKLGGSRGWLLVEGDTGLWRSMSVYFLM
jgi:hypothetical protein